MTSAPDRLASALASFLARDLQDWRGLPDGVTLEDLEQFLPVDRAFDGVAPLGERFRRAEWVAGLADGFPDGVRVWVRGGRVVALDAQRMDVDEVAGLLSQLGEPEARLDAFLGPMPAPRGEWVYPERGVTLFVAGEGAFVDRVVVYAPTTLDEYLQHLRPDTHVVPLPESEGPP